MNLFGKALFVLAVFSFCSRAVQESVPTSAPSSKTQAPSGSPGPSITTSNTSAIKGNTPTSPAVQNKTSQTMTNSSQVSPTRNATNSTATRNATNSTTGDANLLPPASITAASTLTPAMIGLSTNTTEGALRNDTHPENISQNTTQSEHGGTRNDAGKTGQALDTPSYSSIILPVIIALIVITLSVCILVALYKICWKTTPERQENETEHTSLDKENVKLISVKTTAPQSGEHASQGKNKTRQHGDSSSHLGNKCV